MERLNCWEFHECGREPGGAHVYDFGICPSAAELRLDGVHGGLNAGRACWVVGGTLGKGDVRGNNAKTLSSCLECDFYCRVKREENGRFMPAVYLVDMVGGSRKISLRRTERRHPANLDVQYAFIGDQREKRFRGRLINLSDSGACLLTNSFLMEGQTVCFGNTLPNMCDRATVRWVRKSDAEAYVAGLLCCEAESNA